MAKHVLETIAGYARPVNPLYTTFAVSDPKTIPDWNQFVVSQQLGWVSHRAEWCTMLSQAFPFLQVRYVMVRHGANGPIAAILPLFLQKTHRGQRKLISLPHTTFCDPLAAEPEAMQYLVGKLPELMKQEDACTLEIRSFLASDQIESPAFRKSSDYIHHEIALDKTEDELLLSFHRTSIRKEIRRTLKSPLKIREGKTVEDLQTFFNLYKDSRKRLGLPAQPWPFLRSLWLNLHPIHGIELLLVELDGRAIGGLIVLLDRQRASAEMIAYEDETKTLSPNQLVLWSAICRAKASGRANFDFGRTPLVEHNLISVKDRWGTKTRPINHFSMPANTPKKLSQSRIIYELTRTILRRIPSRPYSAFSEFFYRWHC